MKKLSVLLAVLCLSLLCLSLLCACGGQDASQGESAPQLEAGGTSSTVKTQGSDSEAGNPLAEEPLAAGLAYTVSPSMDVVCDLGYVYMLKGGYEWTYRSEDGEEVSSVADSAHPLDMSLQKDMPRLNGAGEAWLRTVRESEDLRPDRVSVRAWPDSAWGDTSSEGEEVPWEGDIFQLLEGGWIYELTLTWTGHEDWGGTARYCFQGVNTPEALALEEDGTMVEDPPVMEVACGEETLTAARGKEGDWSSDFMDSMVATGGGHDYRDPVKERDSLPFFTGEPEAQVSFSWECPPPDYLTVTALSPEGESREVPSRDDSFSLEEGEWIYTVNARWTSHNKWGGEVNYAFVAAAGDQSLKNFPYVPPKLTVSCEASGQEVVLSPGKHQWKALLPDGTWKTEDAQTVHPLEMKEEILWVIGIERVDFAWEGDAPNRVTVQAWPSSAWGKTDTPAQAVEADETGFTMLDGEWIYQIDGEWTGSEEWGGQAAYLFFGAPV